MLASMSSPSIISDSEMRKSDLIYKKFGESSIFDLTM
jgi:hypothetical protein